MLKRNKTANYKWWGKGKNRQLKVTETWCAWLSFWSPFIMHIPFQPVCAIQSMSSLLFLKESSFLFSLLPWSVSLFIRFGVGGYLAVREIQNADSVAQLQVTHGTWRLIGRNWEGGLWDVEWEMQGAELVSVICKSSCLIFVGTPHICHQPSGIALRLNGHSVVAHSVHSALLTRNRIKESWSGSLWFFQRRVEN